MPTRWSFGDIIVIRGIWKGDLWFACPAYVVRDSAQVVVVCWRAGIPVRQWVQRPTVQDLLTPQVQLWISAERQCAPTCDRKIDMVMDIGFRDCVPYPFYEGLVGYQFGSAIGGLEKLAKTRSHDFRPV